MESGQRQLVRQRRSVGHSVVVVVVVVPIAQRLMVWSEVGMGACLCLSTTAFASATIRLGENRVDGGPLGTLRIEQQHTHRHKGVQACSH